MSTLPPPPTTGSRAGEDLVVLVGPTAAGKTAAAIALCQAVGGEIVSADSVQVYRGLDIGSAKATAAERAAARHHLLDVVEPTEPFDAARWVTLAEEAIADIAGRGLLPVVCGGTGLYVRALLHGLSPVPPIDAEVRARVRAQVAEEGPRAAHARLALVDPETAARVAPTDPQRISRALEVHAQTGRPLSAWQRERPWSAGRYRALVVGLWPERAVLHARINARAAVMVREGVGEEVRGLLAAGVPFDRGPLATHGYRPVVAWVQGALPRARLAEAIAAGHRKYARRQLTWFRRTTARDDALVHLDPADGDPMAAPERLVRLVRRWRAGGGDGGPEG